MEVGTYCCCWRFCIFGWFLQLVVCISPSWLVRLVLSLCNLNTWPELKAFMCLWSWEVVNEMLDQAVPLMRIAPSQWLLEHVQMVTVPRSWTTVRHIHQWMCLMDHSVTSNSGCLMDHSVTSNSGCVSWTTVWHIQQWMCVVVSHGPQCDISNSGCVWERFLVELLCSLTFCCRNSVDGA
jgi:hypothetical protein